MIKKSLPFVVGAALVAGCVGLGANAAYGTPPGQEHAQNHTTVLWEYSGYPDITKPQPYVDSVRGADIHAFDEYVKQAGMCGKTFQVDVYKTVVNGKHVSTLWSKGYLEYAHDGGFLAYGLGYTPYKVLTGKDTECATTSPTPTPTPTDPSNTPTTPPVTPEPTPTDTPTSPTTGEPTTQPPATQEPTTPPSTGTPAPEPTVEPTSPATSTPTTPTEPEPTSTATTPIPTSSSTPTPGGTESPAPTTGPTPSQTPSWAATPSTGTSEPSPTAPTKTGSGTTPKTHSTDATARTLAYTGINAVGPLIAAGALLVLGGITLWVARRRKEQ